MIQLRFAALLEKKRERDQFAWSFPEIHRQTGLPVTTISLWHSGKARVLTSTTIITLCEFLECDVGDLIVYVEDEEAETIRG